MGAADRLVAAAANSLVGTPDTSVMHLLSESNVVAMVLVPWSLWQVARHEEAVKGSLLKKDEAVTRARAAAAMDEADEAFWAGSWLRSMGMGLCDANSDDTCGVASVAKGRGAMTCLEVEREGKLVWVCV